MDKIWYRKSVEVGGPRRTDKSRTLKKKKKGTNVGMTGLFITNVC